MGTNNAVNTSLSGQTGTGEFVGATSPTIVTPNIQGITNGSAASAGYVGQILSSTVAISPGVSLSNNTVANITSIQLTPGQWIAWGNVSFSGGSVTYISGWISTTSATYPDPQFDMQLQASFGSDQLGLTVPMFPYNVSSNTTVYLSTNVLFSGSMTAGGGLYALRVR